MIGRVNTAANVLFFLGAFVAQAGMGAIIDLWPTTATGLRFSEAMATPALSMMRLTIISATSLSTATGSAEAQRTEGMDARAAIFHAS